MSDVFAGLKPLFVNYNMENIVVLIQYRITTLGGCLLVAILANSGSF